MKQDAISQDWRAEERFKVIAWLASKIHDGVSEISARDYGERIEYIATKSASFLNANRSLLFHENER